MYGQEGQLKRNSPAHAGERPGCSASFRRTGSRHLFYRVSKELIDLALKNQTKVFGRRRALCSCKAGTLSLIGSAASILMRSISSRSNSRPKPHGDVPNRESQEKKIANHREPHRCRSNSCCGPGQRIALLLLIGYYFWTSRECLPG